MKKILLITLFFFSTNMFSQTSKYIVVKSLDSERDLQKCTMTIQIDDGLNGLNGSGVAYATRGYCSFVKLIDEFESKGYELMQTYYSSIVVLDKHIPFTWFIFKKEE